MAESPSNASPTHTKAIPLHQRIAEHAYALWHAAGRPQGRSEEFWLKAELQVLGADGQVLDAGSGAVSAGQYAESTDANHAKEKR